MPPKSKAASTTTASSKPKAPSTSGTTTPVSTTQKPDLEQLSTLSHGKPDRKLYDAEQEKIKEEIDALQAKLSIVRDKIALGTKSGPSNDRRNVLRSELDAIKDQQSTIKLSRGKLRDQIDSLQENMQKKIKDLQAHKSKIPHKNVQDVDAHIKNLEKQIESGSMKLADEKRALQDISTSRRHRRVLEGFQGEQDAIDADRQTVENLRKQLEDPETKAISDRYEKLKAELDELKKEGDEAYASRSKLYEERDNIQAQLKELYNTKRESAQHFREASDRYWNKVNEDRARRAEKERAQRAAEEAQKKQEVAQRLREEAELPAFQTQIEDCQTLIDFFTGKVNGTVNTKSSSISPKTEVAGVPKLELRKVEELPEGSVISKKKGEGDDEDFFAGGKGKKGRKGQVKSNGTTSSNGPASTTTTSSSLNVPLPTLSALLTLSIPPPTSSADVPRLIEDLQTKKAWFEANQARVTAENVAQAEANIQRLNNAKSDGAAVEVTPPNGGGEYPAEPAPTPQAGDIPAVAVPSTEVVDKLEAVQETEATV